MRYPKPLRVGDTIAVLAPSSGVTGPFETRLDHAIHTLNERGYHVVESPFLRHDEKLVSAPKDIRAKEFMKAYLDPDVALIFPPWGGEFLMEILPLLDWEALRRATPTWVQGFSDISTLLVALTLRIDVATAHGPNLLDFGMDPVHPSVDEAFSFLGQTGPFTQHSLTHYQAEWPDVSTNILAPYALSETVQWKILGDSSQVHLKGRWIGGCLDVLCKLLGTPYAPVWEYRKTYRSDGLLWYLETAEMNAGDIYRTLWQMKEMGVFEHATGLVFGRKDGYTDTGDFTFLDALEALDLPFPVVYDADIGHVPPQLWIVNGALASVEVTQGRATVVQSFDVTR
jgi:muramoyltetrapeptide carboxypeptidase LdcA involved in peptidoglycan recycling